MMREEQVWDGERHEGVFGVRIRAHGGECQAKARIVISAGNDDTEGTLEGGRRGSGKKFLHATNAPAALLCH
jgi:hypothetical protein